MPLPPDFDPDAPAGDATGLYGLPFTHEDAAVVVLAVPWEPTTSYRQGTAHGPDAVVQASYQVDLNDIETGTPWRQGVALAPQDARIATWNAEACDAARRVHEAGGVDPGRPDLVAAAARVDALSDQVRDVVHDFVAAQLAANRIPAVLGGDHSVPLGAMIAAAEHHPGLGILHIDAHADLRVAYEGFNNSHASILHNVLEQAPGVAAVVQVGLRDVSTREVERIHQDERLHGFFDAHLATALAAGTPWGELVQRMLAPLPDTVWVTFDIDGLDPALCPRTGTPVPGGLSWREACVLLAALVASGRRILGFDLVEVAVDQTDDGLDSWDAIVGARLLYKLAGHALNSRT